MARDYDISDWLRLPVMGLHRNANVYILLYFLTNSAPNSKLVLIISSKDREERIQVLALCLVFCPKH